MNRIDVAIAQAYTDEQRSALVSWLAAHDVDASITYAVDIYDDELHAWCYKLNDNGRRFVDFKTNEAAREKEPVVRKIVVTTSEITL